MRLSTVFGWILLGLLLLIDLSPLAAAPPTKGTLRPAGRLDGPLWPLKKKRGLGHIHSILSTPPEFGRGSWNLVEFDHALSLDPSDLVRLALHEGLDWIDLADHAENLTVGDVSREHTLALQYSSGPLVMRDRKEWTKGGIIDARIVNHMVLSGFDPPVGTLQKREASNLTVCPDLDTLYQWLANQPPGWSGTFAHPWIGSARFNRFRLPALPSDQLARLIDGMDSLEGGGGVVPTHQLDFTSGETCFQQALAEGWRVCLTFGLDNLKNPFAKPNDRRPVCVVWVPEGQPFTRVTLDQAFHQRRSFIAAIPLDLRLAAHSEHHDWVWLGGTLPVQPGERIMYRFDATVPWPGSFTVELYGVMAAPARRYHHAVVSTKRVTIIRAERTITYAGSVEFVPDPRIRCFYLRVIAGNGGRVVGITAPIWLERH